MKAFLMIEGSPHAVFAVGEFCEQLEMNTDGCRIENWSFINKESIVYGLQETQEKICEICDLLDV